MLELKSIDAGYGTFQALFGVSLDVKAGEAVGVIGPNGAGKTTLMRVVDRVMVLDHGEKISEGLPSAVASDPRVIEVYLGTDADSSQVAAGEARRRAGD